ncbi:unnamed protein product [Vitrella brassicaformis CCMP3155]|uniref:Transmembrane protein n=1 Tax=Vitrella brassicaformis (strain CCMP3155) TaxID=1169540 RepID=A0A0G4FMG8_VITBC|nr:unnamed protein product [Vitrella brassicaformis CCMP3155]|eukprot:CEM15324.1 unnamed protein product [Vitrella brassicaformis CCMP3155]
MTGARAVALVVLLCIASGCSAAQLDDKCKNFYCHSGCCKNGHCLHRKECEVMPGGKLGWAMLIVVGIVLLQIVFAVVWWMVARLFSSFKEPPEYDERKEGLMHDQRTAAGDEDSDDSAADHPLLTVDPAHLPKGCIREVDDRHDMPCVAFPAPAHHAPTVFDRSLTAQGAISPSGRRPSVPVPARLAVPTAIGVESAPTTPARRATGWGGR